MYNPETKCFCILDMLISKTKCFCLGLDCSEANMKNASNRFLNSWRYWNWRDL